MSYFININGRTIGPMSKAQVFAYQVTEQTPVCTDAGEWAPLFTYPELQAELHTRRSAGAGCGTPYGGGAPYCGSSGKDKVGAGVLALLLGGFGAHYFYCGKIAGGFLTILLSVVTCGVWQIITFVQGILMLTMSQEEFDRKYVYSDSTLPLF